MSHGRFVWYDLFTTDPQAAIAYYGEIVGWKSDTFAFPDGTSMGDAPYRLWITEQGAIGGVQPLPAAAKDAGAPPHWVGNVEVDDLDAAVAKVGALGGTILVPPSPIPGVGRFSAIADPQGAALALVQFASPMPPHDRERRGEIVWHELYTSDNEAALRFYGEIVGWRQEASFDMGPMGKYLIFGQEGVQYGGMMVVPPGSPIPPSWGYYVRVDDLDAAIETSKARGAKVVNGPHDVPGGARAVQLLDPQGAYVCLHALAKG